MSLIDPIKFSRVITERLAVIEEEIKDLDANTEAISPDVSIGRLSRLESMQHQQIALASKRRCEEERSRLHEAERRLLSGTFGRCLLCGGDIAEARLEIQPDAVVCVTCSGK
ncbi:MAG: hypothetical protein SynsKO_17330 [Synoicihabitans sp.]